MEKHSLPEEISEPMEEHMGGIPHKSLEELEENDEPETGVERGTFNQVVKKELEEKVYEALKKLEKREQLILTLRFGLAGQIPLTLKEVGKMVGLSAQGVKTAQEKALEKLGKDSKIQSLQDTHWSEEYVPLFEYNLGRDLWRYADIKPKEIGVGFIGDDEVPESHWKTARVGESQIWGDGSYRPVYVSFQEYVEEKKKIKNT